VQQISRLVLRLLNTVLEKLSALAFNRGAMISACPHDLAFSMIHLYGKKRAFTLAGSYASDCSSNADHHGHNRWTLAASVIGNLIEAEQRLAMLRT
jgi:hypothetical protein